MKKSFFLLLALACSACRNGQLGGPTYTVQVSPGAAAVPVGSTQTFTASFQSDGGGVTGNPSWSLSSTSLGALSPTTGTQVSLLTSSAILGKSGTISATWNGITGTAQVFIGGTLPTPSAYGLLDDTISSPTLQYNVPNPPNANGGALCTFNGGTGSITLATATGSGQYTVGGQSLQATYSGGGTPSTAYGGWYAQWGNTCGTEVATNFSSSGTYGAFSTLNFDILTNGEVQVKVESTGCTGSCPTVVNLVASGYAAADNQFHSVSIPLSTFTTVNWSQVLDVAFAAGSSVSSETFYVDNMRFQK